MVNILHDKDADMSALEGKTVAVIGYGSQGSAQAKMMKDNPAIAQLAGLASHSDRGEQYHDVQDHPSVDA